MEAAAKTHCEILKTRPVKVPGVPGISTIISLFPPIQDDPSRQNKVFLYFSSDSGKLRRFFRRDKIKKDGSFFFAVFGVRDWRIRGVESGKIEDFFLFFAVFYFQQKGHIERYGEEEQMRIYFCLMEGGKF